MCDHSDTGLISVTPAHLCVALATSGLQAKFSLRSICVLYGGNYFLS